MDLIAEVAARWRGRSINTTGDPLVDTRLWPKVRRCSAMAAAAKSWSALASRYVPLESSKLRLTMQGEEPAEVLPFRSERP